MRWKRIWKIRDALGNAIAFKCAAFSGSQGLYEFPWAVGDGSSGRWYSAVSCCCFRCWFSVSSRWFTHFSSASPSLRRRYRWCWCRQYRSHLVLADINTVRPWVIRHLWPLLVADLIGGTIPSPNPKHLDNKASSRTFRAADWSMNKSLHLY